MSQPGSSHHEPGGSHREVLITVADLGEFGLIAAITALLPPDEGLDIGPGDDAAVLRVSDGRVVATTDMLVEGRHFRRDWSGPADVGVKAAARNLADVAAMGARPLTLLVALACPGELAAEWVLEMIGGIVAEGQRAGASVAGGDVAKADVLMLGVTALGDLAGLQPVTRAGARPGDLVAVAGRLGWSAAGLALLKAGHGATCEPDLGALITAHRRPQPPYAAGPAAAIAGASAMTDVSDGLLADLGHVAAASGVRIDLAATDVPVPAPLAKAGRLVAADPLDWVLTGGEDHALAAAFPAGTQLPDGWSIIGTVAARTDEASTGVWVDGAIREGPAGWDHFR
jgi:thiamine-monophosphate kinase